MTSFKAKLRSAQRALARADKRLGRVIERVGPCALELDTTFDPFNALLRAICYQQLHGKAAATIHGRVLAKFGDGEEVAVARVRRARLPSLRACGLSEAKARAILDLAAKTQEGVVPPAKELHRLTDDEVVSRLTQVRGVGRWTVEMMLMFRMGRLDVFPVDDYGIRKGFMLHRRLAEPPTPKALLPLGDAWRPYRTVASWYLWRVADGQ